MDTLTDRSVQSASETLWSWHEPERRSGCVAEQISRTGTVGGRAVISVVEVTHLE